MCCRYLLLYRLPKKMTAVPPVSTKTLSSFATRGVISPTLARYINPYCDRFCLVNHCYPLWLSELEKSQKLSQVLVINSRFRLVLNPPVGRHQQLKFVIFILAVCNKVSDIVHFEFVIGGTYSSCTLCLNVCIKACF